MTTTLAEEERTADSFTALVERLSRQSVTPGKHFDAYTDVDWDAPEMQIDPDDPRWELGDDSPLGGTEWYRSQPQGVRSRIGLHSIAMSMKTGLQFENVLKRGLLEFGLALPNQSPEFRYAYHEVIEEAQHSLMFQEFVNRTGFDVPGMPKLLQIGSRRVVVLGRRFPELFFVFVLGGEDPIDYVQRQVLRSGRELHPLTERIMRIHVTEEARHLSFARHFIKTRAPRLGRLKRQWIAIQAPIILGVMAQLMLRPSPQVVRTYGIPKDVINEAYDRNPKARAEMQASLRKVRQLCEETGLVTRLSKRVWKRFGLWEERSP
jgi:hypothetical protein